MKKLTTQGFCSRFKLFCRPIGWRSLAVLAALIAVPCSQAASSVWTGASGTSANWTDAGNWASGAVPNAQTNLVFTGNVQTINTNDYTSTKQFSGIYFDAGAGAFTLYSGPAATVTLSGNGITNDSPNVQTVNCLLRANNLVSLVANSNNLVIGGPIATTSGTGVLSASGASNVTYSGVISINGGITNRGPGVLTLSGSNSYGGNTVILSGAVKLGASNAIPDGAGKGVVLLNPAAGTAIFDLAGQTETINALTNSGAGTSVVDNSTGNGVLTLGAGDAASIFGGSFQNSAGTLSVVKVGTNTVTLNGVSSHAGSTTIAGGALKLGATGSLGANSTIILSAGATFDVSSQAAYSLGAGAALVASGAGTSPGTSAAYINGGGTIDLGSRSVILNFTPTSFVGDAAHPALYVSGGLSLNGAITITNNGASPLGVGSYKIISQASGAIGGTPTLVNVFGQGLASSTGATVTNIGSDTFLIVFGTGNTPTVATLTRHAGTGSSTTYGDAVQFDVSVTPSAASGLVTLLEGSTVLGTGTLSGGACTIAPALTALTAGTHANIVAVYGGGSGYLPTNSLPLSTQTVAPKTLTVSGVTAASKYYDGTSVANLTGTLAGVVSGDTITYGKGTFANANPGIAIPITSSSTPDGLGASNYVISPLPSGLAADIYAAGVWEGAVDALWNTAGNWTNGLVPGGANVTADFTSLDIVSDTTVNLDGPVTIGHLVFADTDVNSPAGWTLGNNGQVSNTLSFAGSAPSINVGSLDATKAVTLSASVVGSSSLTKQGNGTLILAATNTYSGGTKIDAGTLALSGTGVLGAGNYAGPITNNAVFQLGLTAIQTLSGSISGTGSVAVTGSGAINLLGASSFTGGTVVSAAGVITVGANGALGLGPVTLNAGASRLSLNDGVTISNAITINAAAPGTGNAALNGNGLGTATLNGPITINGGTSHIGNNIGGTVIVNGAITSSVPVHIRRSTVVLSGGGSSASVLLNQDTLKLGANNGVSHEAVLTVASIASRVATFDLNGFNQTLTGLQGPGANSAAFVTNGSVAGGNLTLDTAADSTFGGSIVGNVTLIKTGTAIQTLTGTSNTFTGNTLIAGGTLAIGASTVISNTPAIILTNGGTLDVSAVSGGFVLGEAQALTGSGTVNGSVNALGTVAPGNSIGRLGFSSDLVLAGTNVMEITKVGGLTNDVIEAGGTLTYGGVLRIVLVGNTSLAVNDTFQLFKFTTTPVASFGSVEMPNGYSFDTSKLGVDGTIKVTTVPAVATTPPTITSVTRSGTNLVMVWSGATNQTAVLLSATNVEQPRLTWTPTQTNVVGAGGLSTNVVPINGSERKRFYMLTIP